MAAFTGFVDPWLVLMTLVLGLVWMHILGEHGIVRSAGYWGHGVRTRTYPVYGEGYESSSMSFREIVHT